MRQSDDCAVGDAFPQSTRLTEVVGHQHRLTVPRHHRMHGAKQDGGRHRNEDSTHISAGDFAKPKAVHDRVLTPLVLQQAVLTKVPLPLRLFQALPFLNRIPARIVGLGVRREHIRSPDAGLRKA